MTTLAGLLANTRNHLMSGQPDRLNVLDTSIDAVATTLGLTHELKGIATGTRLNIGLEDIYVVSSSGVLPGSTCTVIRGYNGSAPSAHTAGDIVRVNPQFSDARLATAVNETLDQLSADGLFRVKAEDFIYNPAIAGYALAATDMISVWKVSVDGPGPANDWPSLLADQYSVDQLPDTTDYPGGGPALVLRSPGSAGFKVRVAYRAGFSYLTDLADDVTTVSGLHPEAHRIIPVGTAINVMGGREVKRSFTNRQSDRRLVEEVPPGAALQSMDALLKLYAKWVSEEARRLKKRYPGRY